MKLVEPIQKALTGIVSIKDQHRGDPLFNHLSVVAEGVAALGWFTAVGFINVHYLIIEQYAYVA